MNHLSLNEILRRMKACNDKGYGVHFEGQGDGTVKAVTDDVIFIINNKKNNKNC